PPPGPAEGRGGRPVSPAVSALLRAGRWSRSSRAAMSRRKRSLLSWRGREGRHPPRVHADVRALLVRERVRDPVDEAGAARRDLLELPSVLHGQAEAHGHGRTGGARPAPPREG